MLDQPTDSNYGSSNVSSSRSSKIRNRIRVAKACDRCKQKKTKCDGLYPCKACTKHRIPCIYNPSSLSNVSSSEQADSATEPEGSSNKLTLEPTMQDLDLARNFKPDLSNRPGLVSRLRDRVTVLENDIARLHEHLRAGDDSKYAESQESRTSEENQTELSLSDLTAQDDLSISFTSRQRQKRAQGGKQSLTDDNHPLQHITASQFQIGNGKIHKFKVRYSRKFGNCLPFRLGLALYEGLPEEWKKEVQVPRIQCYGWNMSGGHYIKSRRFPALEELVSDTVGRSLVDYFFDNINPLYAILHRPMFMKQYDAYQKSPVEKRSRLFAAIFHIICALSIRYCEVCENQNFDDGLEERLFDDAYDTLDAFAFEWESFEIIQGLLIMCLYLRACHRQSSTWGVLGTAIRMATGMGIMHKFPVNVFYRNYDILKRERVFWACFVLDRMFCIECGRHFSFREDQISVPIPQRFVADGWQTPISHSLVQLCLCLGDLVYDRDLDLNTDDLKSMKSRISKWNVSQKEFDLNSDIDLSPSELPPALVGHFRLCYYNSLFFIHMRSVFGLVGIQWDTPHTDRGLLVDCVKGVRNVCMTLSSLGKLKTPWWLTLSNLFYAGCVALLLMHKQICMAEMGKALSDIIGLITEITNDGRFIMAKECLWSLKTLNHMVYMRLSQSQEILPRAGMDHGSGNVNKGNFSNMGTLDKQGNEILEEENVVNRKAPPAIPAEPLFLPVYDTNSIDPTIPVQPSSDQGANSAVMSLKWFENWDWDWSLGQAMMESLTAELSGNNVSANIAEHSDASNRV